MIPKKNFSRATRREPPKIPTTYLLAIADKLHSMNPSKVIIYNELCKLYSTAFDNGYQRQITDKKTFLSIIKKKIKEDWNKQKDQIDDLIHQK